MIKIDIHKDLLMSEQARELVTKYYTMKGERTAQEAFARAAQAFSAGDDELAQRIYDYASDGWFMFSSPVLSNAPSADGKSNKGLPISCFLTYVPDSLEGLIEHSSELRWLSVKGGGVGGHWSDVRAVSDKAPGVIPFIHTVDADMTAYRQGTTRKGSYAAYLDIDHPDIIEFLNIRVPTGGDINRKCFNIHNAVNLTDDFMDAVRHGKKWELRDPDTGNVRDVVEARELWQRLLETRYRTGEPYLNFIDTANKALPQSMKYKGLKINGSNLCVAPETKILTDKGYETISELENKSVNVWNGEEFSNTTVRKTGTDQMLLKVVTDSGQELDCTPYHRFYIQDGKHISRVEARDLEIGDKLIKHDLPVIEGGTNLLRAYEQGFYSGDGCSVGDKCRVYLYHSKRELFNMFDKSYISCMVVQEEQKRIYFNYYGLKEKSFVPTVEHSVDTRLKWLAGLLDADGCVARNGTNYSLQLCSVDKQFLVDLQLMLQTLGVTSKIKLQRESGEYLLPKNDGSGELGEYSCKEANRILINSTGLSTLLTLGLSCKRLSFDGIEEPNRDATRFVRVEDVIWTGRRSDTYCFTEPKRNMGMFNGILAGNCNEIHLPTSEDRTAVCCLSSVNLEKYDEWKDSNMVADLITFLDNVLQYFIDNAPDELSKAIYSATQERSLGLGAMGFHSYLQSKNIAWESALAKSLNIKMFKQIKEDAVNATRKLANERGSCPDCDGVRNSHLLSVAPNANSGIILGTSASIEPIKSNA